MDTGYAKPVFSIMAMKDEHNFTNSDLLYDCRELASSLLHLLCYCISDDFSDIGVTAQDLGFVHYK